MIAQLAERKVVDYLKDQQGLENENIVAGVTDAKRELPCIVVLCDSANEYPGTPMSAGLFVLVIKVMVLQSNTESLETFTARTDKVREAISSVGNMRASVNSNTHSNLFTYGFRNLKCEVAVEEQHFMNTYAFEMISS